MDNHSEQELSLLTQILFELQKIHFILEGKDYHSRGIPGVAADSYKELLNRKK
ncbi:hypothetical protein FC07_GL000623 [Loigolactobacillus bifermentans DSM 20003]|jgi:hypothetical protein|uniref:Uncharacterized protein n=1 Tax=Loigolactobacillus bifermentans DSM 20003 TaxID=1423726 RepID=A0A0R1GK13_9LACO|nr:hypothetical protein [Loigolactobacillus bifermentans]KRK34414.1 hypothetical protein FC07_GL000623 [Loigolactobacillus bifermentans DSM 20003]QGG60125.1 hypothetical protein LB003_06470 [Loigolactobacillus bifermentans]